MLKKGLILFVIMIVITGCAEKIGKQDLTTTIQNIEQSLEQEDFIKLKQQANEIKAMYDKHEWKIHLIGDEGEYERLNESINRFITAVEAEELTDAKIELATLKTIVKDIYSL